jgi:lipid-A-disaccharide synthase
MAGPLVFLSAGDLSGDNAAGRVIECMSRTAPNLRCFGLGGPKLAALGQEQLAAGTDLSVMGFWEAARRIPYFRRLLARCVDDITRRRPSVIVLVDYPGFNLRLAAKVRGLGIPIVYYISPQVWAWGRKRLTKIRACVDRMLVILPFEQEFYRQYDVECEFVGNYLLEEIPAEYISSPLPGNGRLALLPGSRGLEIERILPPMMKAAEVLAGSRNLHATVAGVTGAYDYDRLLKRHPGIDIVYNDARRVLYESDVALTASGTATLEAGIIGRPMVVVYKTGFVTYQIAIRVVTVKDFALVNLVAGQRIVPELIQRQATVPAMVSQIEQYLDDAEHRFRTLRQLHRIPQVLGGPGASQRVADLIGGYL